MSLGTNLKEFFDDDDDDQIVFGADDYFEKEVDGEKIVWLVPTAQKNEMEPIKVILSPGAETEHDIPHEGEEFGYVLEGKVKLFLGKREAEVGKGESFYFRADRTHYIKNMGDEPAVIIWLSCPPNF